jgi:GTP cyclohydrolase I
MDDWAPELIYRRLLVDMVGPHLDDEALENTPRRVIQALEEMTAGYQMNPATILKTTFEDSCDEMVVVGGIRFASLCQHHVLPFTGTAVVAYIPDGRVVGLSKIPRVVEAYARRLQIQERMTSQIADAIDEHLSPQGVGVIVRARHECMALRGVRQTDGAMVTSALRGAIKQEPDARAEFLALARAENGGEK